MGGPLRASLTEGVRVGGRGRPRPFLPERLDLFALQEATIPAAWNEALHPRDQFGKWIDKAGALRVGEALQLDSKTTLKKDKDGSFRVTRSGGISKGYLHPADAVRAAADKSAKAKDADSIGGATSHKDVNAYIASRGGTDRGIAPGQITFGGKALDRPQAVEELGQVQRRLRDMRQAATGDKYVARSVPYVEARVAELRQKVGKLDPGTRVRHQKYDWLGRTVLSNEDHGDPGRVSVFWDHQPHVARLAHLDSIDVEPKAREVLASGLTLGDKAPGFARVYDGSRSVGTVKRPDFAPMWTARSGDGTVIGQSATRDGALDLFKRRAAKREVVGLPDDRTPEQRASDEQATRRRGELATAPPRDLDAALRSLPRRVARVERSSSGETARVLLNGKPVQGYGWQRDRFAAQARADLENLIAGGVIKAGSEEAGRYERERPRALRAAAPTPATVPGDATPGPRSPAMSNPMNVPPPDSRFTQENLDAVDASAIVAYDKEADHHAHSVHTPPELKAQWAAAYERTQAALMARAGRKKAGAAVPPGGVPKLAVETDAALAELYYKHNELSDRIHGAEESAKRQAGAKFYYRGRTRVTDMTTADAEVILASELKKLSDHAKKTEGQDRPWAGYSGIVPPHSEDSARRIVEGLAKLRAERKKTIAEMEPLEAVYSKHRWSRFFLVTSSPGHIHSSTSCSTCRPTTRFGWLPDLSGKKESEAVDVHGPLLCSTCFPSAPTNWVGGKLSKGDAENRAENAMRAAKGLPKKWRESELKLKSNRTASYDGGYSIELPDGSVLAGPYASKKDAEAAKRDLAAGRPVRAAG